MSKLEEMIAELCPGGVEYVTTMKIANVTIGEFVHKNKQSPTGLYPVFNGGISNTGLYNEYNRTKNKIIISARGANAGFVNRIFENFWSGNSCYTIDVVRDDVDWNFVYYWLKSKENKLLGEQQKGGIPAVSKRQVESFPIPLPPLPVQREIVRILDNFTHLTTELTAELTARRKQYKFYHDCLLTFSDEVDMFSLSKCCLTIADGDHQAPPKTESGIPFITISNITATRTIDFDNIKFVSAEYFKKIDDKRKPQKQDILYTVVASFGIPVYIQEDFPFAFQRHIAILRSDKQILIPKYLYYVLQSSAVFKQADRAAVGAAQRTITLSSLNKFEIPVPSLAEQQRIVDILDRFDTLCNDITSGLPAEIEARRKQYEYYRDKLLTFKEVGSD